MTDVKYDAGPPTFEQMERELLVQAIKSQGSIAGAALRLGISRATAFRKVNRYGLRETDLAYEAAAPEPDPPEPEPVVEEVKPKSKPAVHVDPLFANWKP